MVRCAAAEGGGSGDRSQLPRKDISVAKAPRWVVGCWLGERPWVLSGENLVKP